MLKGHLKLFLWITAWMFFAFAALSFEMFFVDSTMAVRNTDLYARVLERRDVALQSLRAEEQKVTAALLEEEGALTRDRDDMELDAFLKRASEFDEKSNSARTDVRQRNDLIFARVETEEARIWVEIALPLLEGMRREKEAIAILDAQFVLASDPNLDLTKILTARIDRFYKEDPARIEAQIFREIEDDTRSQ